jgi:hypothetical protein
VFRQYQPEHEGLSFAKGLSPFSIVCPGHAGIQEIQKQIANAANLESGVSMSLADASTLRVNHVGFPSTPNMAVEKLYGWSIVLDVFHGHNHAVCASVRHAVLAIGPDLQRTCDMMGDMVTGMDLICRVMFDMQQEYFGWVRQVAAGHPATVPTFVRLIELVASFRASTLSPLPGHWYTMATCPKPGSVARASVPATAPDAVRAAANAVAVVNTHPDRALVQRFKDSGHRNISGMIGDRTVAFPKHNGKDVCLAWALKGSCMSNCKRATNHAKYGTATNRALHALLTQCELAFHIYASLV